MEKILIKPVIKPPKIELYIGKELLSSSLLKEFAHNLEGKIVVITDEALKDSLGLLLSSFLNAALLYIPIGECAKTKETKEELQNQLFELGCDKKTTLIALGGGVVTDLVGFIASEFLRGISLILIPTTLLAMVDAAIGGKTGINHSFGKNLIGSIYYPKAIFIDLSLLDTLPKHLWFAGFAEIIKLGLIYDASIFERAKKNMYDESLIKSAIKGKISIIQKDPYGHSIRNILNFGHTIAHGLEKVSRYELSHGLAVAIGSTIEAHLSMSLGYLSAKEFAVIEELYQLFPVKLPSSYERKAFLASISVDKKNLKGQLRFVLMRKIGKAKKFGGNYLETVSEGTLIPSLIYMEKKYG